MKNKYLIVFVLSFCITGFCSADNISIGQFPDSPKEGQEVKLTLSSIKYDLNIANITWTVNGTQVDAGIGRKTLTLFAPTKGGSEIVAVKVEQSGYDPSETQHVVVANTNFLIFEGVGSYVPAFYKGRSLPAHEGTARVAFFSFKDGEIVVSGNTGENYTWKINGEENNRYSGQNKTLNQILTRVTDSELLVNVEKEESDGGRKQSTVNIPLQSTDLLVYKTDENKSYKNILGDTETGKEIYLLAEPFYFSVPSKKSTDLTYTWKVNDTPITISTPWSAKFSGKSESSAKINLDLTNNKKITQTASKGFTFKIP